METARELPPWPPLRAFAAFLAIAFFGCTSKPAVPPVAVHTPAAGAVDAEPPSDQVPDPPAPTVALPVSTPVACEGDDLDLQAIFQQQACLVLAPSASGKAPEVPPGAKAELTSAPARLVNHGKATATLVLRNTGAQRAEIYFPQMGRMISIYLNLIDPKTLDVHRVRGHGIQVPEGPPRLLRVVLAPGGRLHLAIPWAAVRQTGGLLPKMTPPSSGPLLPGPYVLVAWTGLPGISPSDIDRARSPSTIVTLVPGKTALDDGEVDRDRLP